MGHNPGGILQNGRGWADPPSVQFFAFMTFAATCTLGAAVSIRLLWVWRRTRELPELALGVSSLSLTLSPIALIVAAGVVGTAPGIATVLFWVGVLLHPVNPSALAIGVWRIYRPQSRLAGAACIGLALALAVWTVRRLADGEIALQTADPVTSGISHAMRIATYLWASVECFRYRALLRRREALGIGAPEIAHRIGLWGFSAACVAALTMTGWWGFAVVGTPLLEWAPGLFVVNGLGLIAAAGLWIAFFPPKAYRERFSSGAGEATPREAS